MKDYYSILGISKNSLDMEIKKAYRKLAFEYHPDRNPGDPEAETKLKDINEAYEVLSEPEKRAQYDSFSQMPSKGFFGGEHFASSINRLFEDLFGEVFNVGSRRRSERGKDLRYDLELDFVDAAFGVERKIIIPKRDRCVVCEGRGAAKGGELVCKTCGGSGSIGYSESFFAINRPCSVCGGRGFIINDPCIECGGEGFKIDNHEVKVTIPPGLDDGMRLKIKGEGEVSMMRGSPGDLFVKIHIRSHPFFSRDGVDIFCEVPILFEQAVLGAEIKIPTLEGMGSIDIPSGTQSGQTFRLEDRGIPTLEKGFNKRGDLFVTVRVEVPVNLNDKQKNLLEEFQSETTDEIYPTTTTFEEKFAEHFEK